MEWKEGSTTVSSHPWVAAWAPSLALLHTTDQQLDLRPRSPGAGPPWNPAWQVQITLISVSKSLESQGIPERSRVTDSSWPRDQPVCFFFTAFRRVLDVQTVTRSRNVWRGISLVLRLARLLGR